MSDFINVLIVDDEEICVQAIKMMLNEAKYSIISLVNGKDTIDYLEKNATNVDILLLDFVLPDMDGTSILEILKSNSKFSHIKIILQTAVVQNSDIMNKYKVKFLHKPYTFKELMKCINQFYN